MHIMSGFCRSGHNWWGWSGFKCYHLHFYLYLTSHRDPLCIEMYSALFNQQFALYGPTADHFSSDFKCPLEKGSSLNYLLAPKNGIITSSHANCCKNTQHKNDTLVTLLAYSL